MLTEQAVSEMRISALYYTLHVENYTLTFTGNRVPQLTRDGNHGSLLKTRSTVGRAASAHKLQETLHVSSDARFVDDSNEKRFIDAKIRVSLWPEFGSIREENGSAQAGTEFGSVADELDAIVPPACR